MADDPGGFLGLGIDPAAIVAGAWAGLVNCYLRRIDSPRAAVGTILTCMFAAAYFSDVTAEYLHIHKLAAFGLTGLTGVIICWVAIDGATAWREKRKNRCG